MRTKILSLLLLSVVGAYAQLKSVPLKVGDSIPDVSLRSEEDVEMSLTKLVSEKPTVIVFYRGGWCPYCNKYLQSLTGIEEEVNKLGSQLLAVSMDLPAKLKATPERGKLHYRLFSDSEAAAIQAFGVAYKMTDANFEKYKGYGVNMEAITGRDHHLLPHPSVFVIDTSGKIRFAYVNSSITERLEPQKILEALKESLK